MTDDKKVVLTQEGYNKLEDELQELKVVRRKDVAAKIKEARGQGDLSENAEYDAAKEEQAEIEVRIVTIEKMLRNSELIDEENKSTNIIGLGNTVLVLNKNTKSEFSYTIVGSAESNPMEGKISNESPIGAALIGHELGDNIVATTPNGEIALEIKAIN